MKLLLFIVCLFIIAPLQVLAELNDEDVFSMTLEELTQVEITGSTLTPESLKTVPSAVTIFTHDEISCMGLDSLDELMNLVPGFQSYRTSGSSTGYPFSSRGRRIGSTSSEVLIVVDGHRLDEPRSSGSALVVTKIPLMQIQRVEFIRGPGAAIYGSNAMLGVINIITRFDENEVGIAYGSFNRKQAYFLASQQLGAVKVDMFGRLDKDDGEDYRVWDTFSANRITTDDPREHADFNIKLKWRGTSVNIRHSQFKEENFYELGNLSNDFNERKGQLDYITLKQEFDWQSVESWLWLSYNHTSTESFAQLTAPGQFAAISDPSSNDAVFINPDFDDYSEVRVQWHNDWYINNKRDMQFGMEMRYIKAPEATMKNNFDMEAYANRDLPISYYGAMLDTTTVQARSSRNIVGIYGQYQHRLFEATNCTLGLRYDNFSSIGGQLSPRLGVVQELNEHHSLKFLYGVAFRAPAENELNLLNNPVVLGNQNLNPETVETWELIWVGQWSHSGASLGYFENHYKDSIVRNPTGIGSTLQYENVSQSPTKGFEFEFSHEFCKYWLSRVAYTYFNENSDFSFREADQLASVMINYRQNGWNANLIANYHDEREMLSMDSVGGSIILDDYWQLSGKLSYSFNTDWQVYVQAKNLLDEDYVTPATTAALIEGVQNRGLEMLAGVVLKF